ncbi:PREDICTED: uncharacterized protein LOC106809398 [Priapulus caudatus]|uniref:Uncharacterized protein LOC106809398 n=1 Tax=Priapulus caudatus TaxID=37621 RepID=A0ABM1E6Y0_PRICU|nr:PREDICTED: uncharacterized protein LOC106809398 [Priapulus caudatus]
MDAMLQRELCDELALDKSVFWSDSMTVLRYIANETTKFRTFVANRVETIHQHSDPSQWRYVSTNQNPADDASRGLTADGYLECTRWLQGPDFLWSSHQEDQRVDTELVESDPELKATVTAVKIASDMSEEARDTMDKLLRYHSTWYNLKRSTAWLLRIKRMLLRKVRNRSNNEVKVELSGEPLTVDEMKGAE